jgi:hypothetical protein
MAHRNSPNDIQELGDLSRLDDIVIDKRRGQRAGAKKNRRNRHYEKQFIRNTLTHRLSAASASAPDDRALDDESSDAATPALPVAAP